MTISRSKKRHCACCDRALPLQQFYRAGGRVLRTECQLCHIDRRRIDAPAMKPIPRDAMQVRLNNLVCLWFGPARPQPRFTI